MALNIGELYATVTTDTSEAQNSLSKFGKKLTDGGSKMKKFGGSLTKNLTGPILGVAAGIGTGIKAFGNYADSLLDLSAQTGISTDQLQRLRQVEKDAGITQDSLANSALELQKNLLSASGAEGRSAQTLKNMGIETKKANGEFKAGDKLQAEAIKKLASMSDKTKRNALAQKLFGGNYKDMLVVVEGGAEAFDASIKKADELGAVVGGDTLKAANDARVAFSDMGTTIKGKLFEALGNLMPLFQDTLVPLFVDKVIPAIMGIIDNIGKVVTWFTDLDSGTQKIIGIFILLLAALGPIVTIAGTLATVIGFLLSPMGLVVAAVVAIIAIGVLLYKNWDKIKAWAMKVFPAIWEAIKGAFAGVLEFFAGIWDGIKAVFAVVGEVLLGFFTAAWEAIKAYIGLWVAIFQGIWDGISKVFSVVKDVLLGFFTDAWEAIKNVFSGVGSFFGDLWDTIKSTFSTIGGAIGDAIGSAFKKVVNSIINFAENSINGFIKAINLAVGLINKIPGVNIGTVGTLSIPRLARGAVVNSPTLAEIGERGREAVVPLTGSAADQFAGAFLSRLNGLGGPSLSTGNGITVNINGDVKDPAQFAKMISREIQKETDRKKRSRGR